ncbi:hypothetical protein [Paractinoplanes maris]|uniref:hypothetical protein n=1 Tax=Paractinoplanes maris TaxID=1734446 RepID=UPI0020221749|nr:hypothetical protein [Actinoplanes maris]
MSDDESEKLLPEPDPAAGSQSEATEVPTRDLPLVAESAAVSSPPLADADVDVDVDVDGEETTPIDSDSVRVDPRVADEMFGDLYTDTTAHGPTQLGSNNTMYNFHGKRPLDPIIGEVPGLKSLAEVYVPTKSDVQLDEFLSQRAAVCLVGLRNSGRYSSARAALYRRYKPGHIYEVALPNEVPPEALTAKPDRLPEESGFILRLSGDGATDTMRMLAPLFRKRRSTLLLIRDEGARRGDLQQGAEVRHEAPDQTEVFRRHLQASLPPANRGNAERYLTEDVAVELKAASGPKECVAIARAIAKVDPDDEGALRLVLNRSQPRRRERATAILLPGKETSTTRGRRAGQHERAFRLSYAVFYRRPLHYVFEAADWLLREIDSAALRPEWGSMALQHPVQDLLGDELRQDWEAGRQAGDAEGGTTRTAWIRDPGLRGSIIDVAWHDFDGTRRSLLHWLDRLVEEGDNVMRRAAAETAGVLVHHDFDRVHHDLVDRWAGSRRPAVRQAAAWTMTLSDMAGDVRPQVRAKLSEWCSGSRNLQRDTAARVYVSGLEQTVLAWSMLDLARIAKDPGQRGSRVVAAAVNQLYRPDRASFILAELAEWAALRPPPATARTAPRDPLLQAHAVRALLKLTTRVDPESLDSRYELLSRLVDGHIEADLLGPLWLIAFYESSTAPAAADALARWIRQADANRELRPYVIQLLDAIFARSTARRRINFYMTKTSGFRGELPDWTHQQRRWDS